MGVCLLACVREHVYMRRSTGMHLVCFAPWCPRQCVHWPVLLADVRAGRHTCAFPHACAAACPCLLQGSTALWTRCLSPST